MKRIFLAVVLMGFMASVNAEIMIVESGVNQSNYWNKTGIEVQKVLTVSRNIMHANGLKRAPIKVERNWRIANASTNKYTKSILVNTGMLPYVSNDDELAFVIGHELAHAQECYGGVTKLLAISLNGKKYEYKADLRSIDYMVNAGYNPIAAIIMGDKLFDEPLWDWGFTYSHPKGSKRLIAMYEYIYKKYPSYLNSSMTQNTAYIDFLNSNSKSLDSFRQKQAKKANSL